jgi:beta-lactamase regulating signal transducer with metallopeptidase domain/peroxiredoxin
MIEQLVLSLSAIVHLWAGGMLRALGHGTLFVLGAWLLCRLFRRIPAAARAGLWWLACVKLLIALTWAAPLSLPILSPPPQAAVPPPQLRTGAATALVSPVPDGSRAPGVILESAAPPPAGRSGRFFPAVGLLMALWAGGLLWRLIGMTREWHVVRQLLRRAREVTDAGIRADAARLHAALGLRRLPRLLEAPGAPGPLVIGLLRPVVLLPEGVASRLSPEELRMALAHELAHVRRRDLWWSLPPHLARWLFYFYPLAALACREWVTAREAACDAAALRATGVAPAEYGRLLLKLTAQNSGHALLALGATAGFESLKRRLTMLQDRSLSRRAWCGLITLMAAVAVAAVPWRLTARAARASTPTAHQATSDHEAQLAACERQLAEIGRALAAYQQDHGELPAHLTDLFPKYVSDLKLFHCPADHTGGSPHLADDYADDTAPPSDPRPVSYAYYMSPVKLHLRFGGLGGPRPRGADDRWRGQMLAMREQFGDRVPVVRCWHHAKSTYEAYSRPLVPSLTLDGNVYRSAGNWQTDPQTLAVVTERMEGDLAQGAARFMSRWNLGAIALQFGLSPPIPALKSRLEALAARLEALSGQPLTPDSATHLPTDLPAAIGSLYHLAGDTDRAIAAYQTALDHLDRSVPYYWGGEWAAANCLPALYAAKGQHEKAIAVYQRILQKDPEKWDWYILMAREYEAMGQTRTALALRRKWDPSGQIVGKPAPEFEMADQSGRMVDLAKLRGRAVVLFFWYNPYRRMGEVANELDLLQRKYRDRGLTVVCLTRLTDMGSATARINKDHSYPLLLGADPIYQKYGVGDSSMLFILDQRGKLLSRYLGYGMDPGEERWLEHETRKLLGLEVAAR